MNSIRLLACVVMTISISKELSQNKALTEVIAKIYPEQLIITFGISIPYQRTEPNIFII